MDLVDDAETELNFKSFEIIIIIGPGRAQFEWTINDAAYLQIEWKMCVCLSKQRSVIKFIYAINKPRS